MPLLSGTRKGEACGLVPHGEGKAISLCGQNSTKPGDISGIGRYFRFKEDNM